MSAMQIKVALVGGGADWIGAAVAPRVVRFDKLTVPHSVAGISGPDTVSNLSFEFWQPTIDINLNGSHYGRRTAQPLIASAQ